MKCSKCGSDDVTQSKGKCNECLWIYEEEQKKKKEEVFNFSMFIEDELKSIKKFEKYWIENHKKDPENWPIVVPKDNSGLWFEQYMIWCDETD